MITSDICQNCGAELEIGSWPFCPHGKSSMSAHTDDIPGGMWMENLGPEPVKVYSHTERERIMKERGLELKEKFCPMPGTDIDPAGVQNPRGYVDATTLANGAALICRQQTQGKESDFDGVRDGVIRNQFSGHLTGRDVAAVGSGDPRRSARLGRRTGH